MNQFADLLGDDEPDIPDEPELEPVDGGRDFFRTIKTGSVHDLRRGVTFTWLCQAFMLTRPQAEKRLRGCPIERAGKNGMKVYDFKTACGYLATPKVNVREYIESLDPKELPENLRGEYWGARIKEQKARLNAKNLWLTPDVQGAFAEVFKTVSETIKLWTDTIDENVGLTSEQVEIIDALSRDLRANLAHEVEAFLLGKQTASQEQEFEDGGDDVS